MTIQELEYFYDLAQTLSFSMTAERLYVTQPVVSKHIRLLEESLGYPLIDRSIRKRIRLTKSGELLFQCLQTCRSSWNETLKKISELQDTTQISYYLPEDQILPQHIVSKFDEFRKLSARNTPAFKILEKGQAKEILSEKGFLILPDYMEIKGNYDQRRIQTNRNDSLMLISAASHPAAEKDLHA